MKKHLSIVHKHLMMSMKIQKTITQKRTELIVFVFVNGIMVFDDMIADMEATKKLSPIVTELF